MVRNEQNKKTKGHQMQLSKTNVESVTASELITWARDINSDDLKSFVNYRSNLLGDLDDDDFELASI